jgi:pimeloyl-ACP methyl ester carboxylesterase
MKNIVPVPRKKGSAQKKASVLNDYIFAQFLPAPAKQIKRRQTIIGITVLTCFVAWLVLYGVVHILASINEKQKHESKWYREPTTKDSGLIVLVHGWSKGPETMMEVAEVVKDVQEYGDYGIYLWDYGSNKYSNKDPLGIAQNLANHISSLLGQTKKRIVLIGHSLGGLLVRRAYLIGLTEKKDWATQVDRIILLAAPNRGTQATSRSPWLWVIDNLARSVNVGGLIRSIQRGAPFIVDLRNDWIKQFNKLENPPLVAQIVGSIDSLVNPSDSIDVTQFRNSLDRQLPNSTHLSIVNKNESGEYIKEMLLAERSNQTKTVEDEESRVIKLLIVHGIRDYGDRFDKIRDATKNIASTEKQLLIASAPRYKYFSAIEFVNPISRRDKIYEFADLYMEMLATPPTSSPIYFVGHSFGTYLMAKSVERYKSINFERAYFAGSVLKEEYFKEHEFLGNRIGYLRNDIATNDWPVGLLCSGLSNFGFAKDIGTGGFNGFSGIANENRYEEVRYFDGGHGKALEQANQATIADWLLKDVGSAYQHSKVVQMLKQAGMIIDKRGYLWGLVSRAAPGIFILVIGLAGYLLLFGRRPLLVVCEAAVIMWLLNIA